MGKSKKQKEAEELFEDVISEYAIDLNPAEYKLMRKLCVEVYEEGYYSGVAVAQDKMNDLLDRLT